MVAPIAWLCGQVCRCLREITVEPVLFLYMVSIFSQYALFQDLVYSKVCWAKFDENICDNLHEPEYSRQLDFVQESSSHWILLATLSTGIPSVFMAIYLGSWSDRFGRKWPVAIPPLGGILACIVYMLISFIPTTPVALICFASLLSGLTGGFISCIMSCMTYVSSVTTNENRTIRISRLEAMIYLGGTIGPFISGYILPFIGHGFAFGVMLVCYLSAFLYTALFVRDIQFDGSIGVLESENYEEKGGLQNQTYTSISSQDPHCNNSRHSPSPTKSSIGDSDDETREFFDSPSVPSSSKIEGLGCSKYFSAEHFVSAVKTCCKERHGNRRFYILALISAGFITMMITSGELDVAYLFTRDHPLIWTYQTYAYYLGYKFGLGAIALLLLMPVFQKANLSDSAMCIIGLVSRMAGLICFGLSNSTEIAFLAPVASIFSFYTIPSVRALLSKLVLPSEQGKMFAFIAIAEDLCSLTASILFNSIYPLTRSVFRGFIFQLAACILVVPLLIMMLLRRNLTAELLNPPEATSPSCDSPERPDL